MKKLLILLWCLYFSATCKQGGTAQDLIFIKATSQQYSGGAAGSGHGTGYKFYFIAKKQPVTCDSVWVDSYVLPVQSVVKGDTLLIEANEYFRGQMGPHGNVPVQITPKKENAPITDKAVAIIGYTKGTSKKFITITTVTRLKPIDYP